MKAIRRTPLPAVLLFSILFMTGVAAAAPVPAPAADSGKGSITGAVTIRDGGLLAGGQIMFYNAASGPPPSPGRYERTPDQVRDLGADGRFDVELVPGRYYLAAVKRRSGERRGPPQEGDLVWKGVDGSGKHKEYLIEPGKRLDIGTGAEAVPFKRAAPHAAPAALQGRVIDAAGNPVPDAVVAAFLRPVVQARPVFVSGKTGKDGAYLLRVAPGTYYLRVRNAFAAGPPEPGQIVGFYGEGQPAPVTIGDGEVLKDIHVRTLIFPGRGPLSGGAPAGK